MPTLVVLLLGLVGGIVARVLVALGFAVVTIYGVDAALDGLKAQFIASFNQMPADMISLFNIAGGGIAVSMIFGAFSFKLALWTAQKGTSILGVNQ